MPHQVVTRARRTIPPDLPAFCSDVAEHWPSGKLPELRPRSMDPDAPPAPVRPGEGYTCPHELAVDRLTADQAARGVAQRPGRLEVNVRATLDELLDAAEDASIERHVRPTASLDGEVCLVRYTDPANGNAVEHL